MCKLSHPNIVPFLGYCASAHTLVLAMGLATRGTVKTFLKDEQDGALSEPQAWSKHKLPLLIGIARGMQYIHAQGILHRDLKNENILLNVTATGKPKPWIADFGESAEKLDYTMTSVGTPLFCAPEVLQNERYDETADVYSFAVILYSFTHKGGDIQVAFAKDPSSEQPRSHIQISYAVIEGWRPEIADTTGPSDKCKQLIQRCWSSDCTKRPSFDDIALELHSIQDNLRGKITLAPTSKARKHSLFN